MRNRAVFVADSRIRIERNKCGYRKVSRVVDMTSGLLKGARKSSGFLVIGNLIEKSWLAT